MTTHTHSYRPSTASNRVACPSCGRVVAVTTRDRLYRHNAAPPGYPCNGSGRQLDRPGGDPDNIFSDDPSPSGRVIAGRIVTTVVLVTVFTLLVAAAVSSISGFLIVALFFFILRGGVRLAFRL